MIEKYPSIEPLALICWWTSISPNLCFFLFRRPNPLSTCSQVSDKASSTTPEGNDFSIRLLFLLRFGLWLDFFYQNPSLVLLIISKFYFRIIGILTIIPNVSTLSCLCNYFCWYMCWDEYWYLGKYTLKPEPLPLFLSKNPDQFTDKAKQTIHLCFRYNWLRMDQWFQWKPVAHERNVVPHDDSPCHLSSVEMKETDFYHSSSSKFTHRKSPQRMKL